MLNEYAKKVIEIYEKAGWTMPFHVYWQWCHDNERFHTLRKYQEQAALSPMENHQTHVEKIT